MNDLLRECRDKFRLFVMGYDDRLAMIAKIDAALAADALSAAQTYPDRRFEIAALEQKLPWPWTGSISKERYGDTPPEPKRLPSVAEMRGILSEENTNAAPQGATISNNGRPENPTGTAQSPAVAAPEPQQEPVADEHLPWLQVWLDEKIVRATGVRREVLEDLQHELDARPSPQAAEQEPVAWDASVFKGSEGLRGLLDEQEFWDRQLYGTRLYYGAGGMDYLHRDVLRAAVDALARPSPQAASEAVKGPEEYQYARRLAEALSERHYGGNKDWRPLPDLMGVLTQIDNMTCRLERPAPPAAAESVSVPTEAMLLAAQTVDYPVGTVPGTTGFPYYRAIYLAMQAAKESP